MTTDRTAATDPPASDAAPSEESSFSTTVTTEAPPNPQELCGYAIASALSANDDCFLAIGPGGRGVVLRRMPAECVVENQLHPLIKERLTRVREIAHAGIANLHGVGREVDGSAWMIWEYVEGQPFEAYASQSSRTPRELAVIGRELTLTVEALHLQGVVHGALDGKNVFVTPYNTIRLTNVSPLLFTDPAADSDAVIELLSNTVEARGGRKAKWPLAKLLDEATEEAWPLRTLAARLAATIESRSGASGSFRPSTFASIDDERKPHRRSLLAAFVVVLLGFATAFAIWYKVGQPGRGRVEQWIEPVKARLR
jgi:serine/threonine protein kinase